jgi:hypothetical protein
MKKITFPLLLIVITAFLFSCGPTKDDAIKWNDSIIEIETDVDNAVEKFSNALDKDGADLEKELAEAVATTEQNLVKIKAIEDFKDGAAFKASGIEFMGVYLAFLKNEAKEIVAIAKNPNPTEEDVTKLKEHLTNTDTKFTAADTKFVAAQKEFADKWGFQLK